jgi:prolyl-tRNA synthetase
VVVRGDDAKALQMGTSHKLGQNSARAFDIRFSDRDGQPRHVWQTSWGVPTRLLGAMIMVHGDDHGLRVRPRLARIQVLVLVARGGDGVVEAAATLVDELERAGVGADLDDKVDVSLGKRIVDHELRDVPLRLGLGPRDLAADQAVVADCVRAGKETVALRDVARLVPRLLADDQKELLAQATALRHELTRPARSIDEAAELANVGFAPVVVGRLRNRRRGPRGTRGRIGRVPVARGPGGHR